MLLYLSCQIDRCHVLEFIYVMDSFGFVVVDCIGLIIC